MSDLRTFGSTDRDDAIALAEFIEAHPDLILLTGAGISTASGIPGYRDREGVRRGKAPILGQEFRSSEAVRKRYWARSMIGWSLLAAAAPNAGHYAITELEAAGKIKAVITQNVDGLHQRAGSIDVIELHGNIHTVICFTCGTRFSRCLIQSMLQSANPAWQAMVGVAAPDGDAHVEPGDLDGFQIPCCLHCEGVLMPDVVFFGDGVPPQRTQEAMRKLEESAGLLIVGSSLMVHSGYRFRTRAKELAKPVVAINIGKTRADPLLCMKIEQRAEHMLPMLRELLLTGGRQAMPN